MDDLGEILTRLEDVMGPLAGAPAELDGGITNRNLRLALADGEYVLRRPGAQTELLGIDRESERIASEAAAALGIAPPVARALDDCLLTRFVSSRQLTAREVAVSVREVALALRDFHDSATRLPTRFSVPNLMAEYAKIVYARGGALPEAFAKAQATAARIAAALPVGMRRPCHNDLLAANFIRADASISGSQVHDGQLLIVDWEYAGMGDPRFDLGNLSVNNEFDDATDERLLSAYLGRAPGEGERAAHGLMRVLSDAREGAWGVVQGHLSELEFDFDAYAEERFSRMSQAVEGPLFERWIAAVRSDGPGERDAQAT